MPKNVQNVNIFKRETDRQTDRQKDRQKDFKGKKEQGRDRDKENKKELDTCKAQVAQLVLNKET